MRVLFISGELIAGDLAYRLKLEGCDVKLFIEHPDQKHCLDGFVEKTDDWKKELDWVGKDGLIIFDDVGYGKIQDDLRKDGYSVVGGSEGGDKLEKDREFGQEILKQAGMSTISMCSFSSPDDAIGFIKENPKCWVVKQNTHQSALNYVGMLPDGRDVISTLESYTRNGVRNVTLQEKMDGIEVSINRYFNGDDWVGPSEITLEHKSLFNGDIGPKTGEMGNLMWYDDSEGKLFQETLERLKPYLQQVDFRGDIDINTFIKENTVLPIEITSRFGCPITHSQSVMHVSPWNEFLSAVAKGGQYELKHKNGYCIALVLALPPFPYEGTLLKEYSSEGLEVFFSEELTKEEINDLHFEGVEKRNTNGSSRYFVTHSIGYTMFVTGRGDDVAQARDAACSLARKIVIPKIFYRTDIGEKFQRSDEAMLRKWNWI